MTPPKSAKKSGQISNLSYELWSNVDGYQKCAIKMQLSHLYLNPLYITVFNTVFKCICFFYPVCSRKNAEKIRHKSKFLDPVIVDLIKCNCKHLYFPHAHKVYLRQFFNISGDLYLETLCTSCPVLVFKIMMDPLTKTAGQSMSMQSVTC